MATTTIEPDSDLEQMRAWIERFKEDEEEEVRLSSLVLTGGGGYIRASSPRLGGLSLVGEELLWAHSIWHHALLR